VGDSCRPFHGLDGVLNLTQGSASGSTLGFMLTHAAAGFRKELSKHALKVDNTL